MTTFRAAVLQMRSGREPADNAAALEALVAEAVAGGAHYVQSPEMTGMLQRDRAALMDRLRTEDEDLLVATASGLARRYGIHLHLGSIAVALEDGRVANRALLFAPDGQRVARYDKIHMFDVDLDNGESWRESATYQPGEKAVVAVTSLGRLGLAVCYDLRFPQLFRAQALAGAQVLTVPAAAGSVVMPGEAVATIGGGGFFLRLAIPERHARALREGDEIRIDGADDGATGRLARIYPQIENGRVIADVAVEGLAEAFVDARVLVRLAVGQRTALLVPETAVTTRAGLDFVTVAGAHQGERAVMLGQRHEKGGVVLREILSGLAGGETVVLK